MKHIFTQLIALLAVMPSAICAMAGIRVTDAEDGSAINGATVMARSGVILGITDINGNFSGYNDNDFPLTVRCLGYEQAECEKGTEKIEMRTVDYQLPEYTVTADGHPISRMLCLIREYSAGATPSDTVQYLSIHIGDLFYKDKDVKVKGFKHADGKFRRILTRTYERNANNKGLDSIAKYDKPSEMSWLSLISIPTKTRRVKNLEVRDTTVTGKFGPKQHLKITPNYISIHTDALADYEGHVMSPMIFKLLGMTIDINELQGNCLYRTPDNGKMGPEELISGSVSMQSLAKGKVFKWIFHSSDPIQMNGYFEYYPISIEYLTAEEAKELYDNPPAYKLEDYTDIPNLSPLPQSVQTLIERAEKEAQ